MIGEEIQKLSIIQNIPELMKEDYEGCLSKIIPKMNQGLVQGSVEYHFAASKSVQKILKQNMVQPQHFKVNFLKTILRSIDNRDPDIAKAWLDTLLEAIRILKEDVIIEEILPVAQAKAQHTESVFRRAMSCHILGRIAEYCSTYMVQKSVLGVVQALCQDVDKNVRASMCLQLPQLARPLAASYERDLLPILNDCVNDDQAEVRATAYCALVQSLALVNPEILRHSFLPMAKKIIEQCLQSVHDGILLIDLTEQYGNLCLGLESVMNDHDKLRFADNYIMLAEMASSLTMKFKERVMDRSRSYGQARSPHNSSIFVDSRVNCALNMPAIIYFCRDIGSTPVAYFTRSIYPLMCMLCADSQYAVRRAIASVMHEIAESLGKSNRFILKEFIKLLNDDSEDVLQSLIPNIKKCLEYFCESETFSPEVVDDKSIELTRSLFTCEMEVSATYNWRLQTEFLQQIEVLTRCLPSNFIYSQFFPFLRKRLSSYRPVECRVAVVRTLLVFLRYNNNMNQRNDIRNTIITELCTSRNFYNRSIYVRSIPHIFDIFSSVYFRTHFFIPTIALMEDRVANIRFMMCDLMPQIKCIAALDKTNHKYVNMCDMAIEKTKEERDRLVLEHIATMKKQLDKFKLDDRDATKIKEEKMLDAVAATTKDSKSHFANIQARANPARSAPRAFEMRDVRPVSTRISDPRHNSSHQHQQTLTATSFSSQTPAPASNDSRLLSPDIISYDMFPNFNQVPSHVTAMNDLGQNFNFSNLTQVSARNDFDPNLDQVLSNENARYDLQQFVNRIPSNRTSRTVIDPNSNFPNLDQVTRNEAATNYPPSPPYSRCMSPDIIRNSKSSLRDNLPDIALNYPTNSPQLLVGSEGNLVETSKINESTVEYSSSLHLVGNFGTNNTYFVENVCLEEYSGRKTYDCNQGHENRRNSVHIVQDLSSKRLEENFSQRFETDGTNNIHTVKISSPECPDESFGQEIYDSNGYFDQKHETRRTNNISAVENTSSMLLEETFGQRKTNHDSNNTIIIKHSSSECLEETFSSTHHTDNEHIDRNPSPKCQEGSFGLETYYSNNDQVVEDNTSRNPPDSANIHNSLNETFKSNSIICDKLNNSNKNSVQSSMPESFRMCSTQLLNNNSETTPVKSILNSNESLIMSEIDSSLNNNFETVPVGPTSNRNRIFTLSSMSKIESLALDNDNVKTAPEVSTYNLNELHKTNFPNSAQGFADIFETRSKFESSSILIDESTSNETNTYKRNSEYDNKMIDNDSCKVDIDEAVILERGQTVMFHSNEIQELYSSPSLESAQNNYTGNVGELEVKNTISAKILVKNNVSEGGNNESLEKLNQNYANNSHDSNLCQNSLPTRIENISNDETNNIASIGNNHSQLELSTSKPILNYKVDSNAENNDIEKQNSQTNQSLWKRGDILSKDQLKMSDSTSPNRSPLKLSKNASSGIPTINKSPRRSLAFDSGCTPDHLSSPMNPRRSLAFDSGDSSDHSSIPSKKSQRNSLNLDIEGTSETCSVSTINKSSRRSLVFDNQDSDSSVKKTLKSDSAHSSGIIRLNRLINKASIGFQNVEESKKSLQNSVSKSFVVKKSEEGFQKLEEPEKNTPSSACEHASDNISDEGFQNTPNKPRMLSPVLKCSNNEISGEGFKTTQNSRKPSQSSIFKRSIEKNSEKCYQKAEEPGKPSQNAASDNLNDKISNKFSQNTDEAIKSFQSPISKHSIIKISEEGFQNTEEPGKFLQSPILNRSTENISEKCFQKEGEPSKPSVPMVSADKISAECSQKMKEPKKSLQNPISKRTSIQAPQKSFLPIRAPKNVQNYGASCGESPVTTSSKRHSLGTFSADNAISINKQLSRKSEGRPQSLVLNSSRLPVRSSSSSIGGISRVQR